jgi:hypothetical protein
MKRIVRGLFYLVRMIWFLPFCFVFSWFLAFALLVTLAQGIEIGVDRLKAWAFDVPTKTDAFAWKEDLDGSWPFSAKSRTWIAKTLSDLFHGRPESPSES